MLLLVSSSKRRIELLKKFKIPFKVIKPKVEPKPTINELPQNFVIRAATMKIKSVLNELDTGIVISADTIVYCNNEFLLKPRSKEDAFNTLKKLSGKVHEVYTGIVVHDIKKEKILYDYEVTKVKMKDLTASEIELYIRSGEPIDKAGAYAIQGIGALFIEKIIGDYFNVVGLPIYKLSLLLKNFGIDLLKYAVLI